MKINELSLKYLVFFFFLQSAKFANCNLTLQLLAHILEYLPGYLQKLPAASRGHGEGLLLIPFIQ